MYFSKADSGGPVDFMEVLNHDWLLADRLWKVGEFLLHSV